MPRRTQTALLAGLVLVGLGFHAWTVYAWGWVLVQRSPHARDYASYHYAVRAALAGDDPYDKEMLAVHARREGTRSTVHPFFYPPPFLLGLVWTAPLSLKTAYHTWFFLNLASVWIAALALWRWWRPLGSGVGTAIFAMVCVLTAIPDNLAFGQANLPVLALVCLGAWQADVGRRAHRLGPELLGGVLLGAACMAKMSPALFVAWWMLRGRWRAAAAACGSALVLSGIAVLVFGIDPTVTFYARVLPGFSSGDYNGLSVSPSLWANHSIPNIWHELFPSGGNRLTPLARALSTMSALLLVGGLGFAFRRPARDDLAISAQFAAISAAILLIPVYTYEHHLVFAIPAAALATWLVLTRRLPRWPWLPIVGFAVVAWAFERSVLQKLARNPATPDVITVMLREAKFVALLLLVAVMVAASLRPAKMAPATGDRS